jgi:hypothetical protein
MTPEHKGRACHLKHSKDLRIRQTQKNTGKKLQIKDPRGNDLGYKGTYIVPMQITGRKLMHELEVL